MKIEYDDQTIDIVDYVNKDLEKHGLKYVLTPECEKAMESILWEGDLEYNLIGI